MVVSADAPVAGDGFEPLHPMELVLLMERLETSLQGRSPDRRQWLALLKAARSCADTFLDDDMPDDPEDDE
jgi:hypothetical protein